METPAAHLASKDYDFHHIESSLTRWYIDPITQENLYRSYTDIDSFTISEIKNNRRFWRARLVPLDADKKRNFLIAKILKQIEIGYI